MTGLIKTSEAGAAWYPVSIRSLEAFLEKVVYAGRGYDHSYALRKNLAYNLQYLEFQDRVLLDIKISSVLYTQTVKTFVLVGAGIVESILHFLLVVNGVHTTTDWEEKASFKGNEKTLDGEKVRVDTTLFAKLSSPKMKQMSFDAMIKCSKSNKVLGSGTAIYQKLNSIRLLRNKVHLQAIDNPGDTDWNSFNASDLSDICKVVHAILTSNIFSPDTTEKSYFSYLKRSF